MSRSNQAQQETTSQNRHALSSGIAKPLITTIIPTYRRPKLLRRAIKSVLNQTYPHFQVCVYDNASGDETADVVAEFSKEDPRVKYHGHAENIGALNNFNFGLKAVATPFFSFLSDDDILLPEFFEAAMGEFEEFPEAAFSGGTTITMTEHGKILGATLLPSGYFLPPEGLFKMMEHSATWTSIVFRKGVIDKIGSLDANVGGYFDRDFLFRIAAHLPFVNSKRPVAIWMAHLGSSCATTNSKVLWPGQLKAIRNLTEDEQLPLEVRTRIGLELTSQLKQSLFGVGGHSIIEKNFGDAYEVATILGSNFGQTAKARMMVVIAWCCENLPLTHSFLLLINRVRTFFRWRSDRKLLQKQFGSYSRFLKED